MRTHGRRGHGGRDRGAARRLSPSEEGRGMRNRAVVVGGGFVGGPARHLIKAGARLRLDDGAPASIKLSENKIGKFLDGRRKLFVCLFLSATLSVVPYFSA